MGGTPVTRPWRSLVLHGPFSRLFWAGFISSVGDWAALFAQISLADAIAGSQGVLVVLAARVLPGVLGGAVGGVLADRVNRKVSIVLADFGRGLLVLSLAFVETLPELFAASFVLEMLTLLGQPARAAVVPQLVAEENLLAANSLTLTSAYGTFPLGAGVAWVLGLIPPITFLGLLPESIEATLFAADSLTFIASGVLVLTIPIGDQAMESHRKRVSRFDWRAPVRDFFHGLRFVIFTPRVRGVILGMSVALFGGGMLIVIGKGYAEDTLSADSAGFFALLFALGTGAALGIVGLTAYGDRLLRRDVGFGFALAIAGIGMGAAGLVQTVAGAMGWLAVMGFGGGASYVLGFTYLHEQVDDQVRGRTFAALFSLMRVGLLVAMLVATNAQGLLEGRFGAPFHNPGRVILVSGGLIVLGAGAGILWSLRDVFAHPKPSPEAMRSIEAAGRAFRRFRRNNNGSNRRNGKG